jgi:hypothetical protein
LEAKFTLKERTDNMVAGQTSSCITQSLRPPVRGAAPSVTWVTDITCRVSGIQGKHRSSNEPIEPATQEEVTNQSDLL